MKNEKVNMKKIILIVGVSLLGLGFISSMSSNGRVEEDVDLMGEAEIPEDEFIVEKSIEEEIKEIFEIVFSESEYTHIDLYDNELSATGLGRSHITSARQLDIAIIQFIKQLQSLDQEFDDIYVTILLPLIDIYGNVSTGEVFSILILQETLQKINWENVSTQNLSQLADFYWVSPLLA